MRLFRLTAVAALFQSVSVLAAIDPKFTWTLTPTNTSQQFRGLSPVTDKVTWVSGTRGTVLRTNNSGLTWTDISPPFDPSEDRSSFEFRDIHAWSAKAAVVLSIGEGNASRIHVTRDGGATWNQTFINDEASAFYDCMAFEKGTKSHHGLAMSDPVNGKFRLIETWDGGLHWSIVPQDNMPPALTGEFGFAASGTCIEAVAGRWYIASGGVDPGRIFYSSGNSSSWSVTNSSIAGGPAAGVFSVRFRDSKMGVAVGGDFEKPTLSVDNAAWSDDGGESWHRAESFPAGYRSGVSWVPGHRKEIAIAVGTSGSDYTLDGGRNWNKLDNGTFDAVECISKHVCWASGSRGRVAKLELRI